MVVAGYVFNQFTGLTGQLVFTAGSLVDVAAVVIAAYHVWFVHQVREGTDISFKNVTANEPAVIWDDEASDDSLRRYQACGVAAIVFLAFSILGRIGAAAAGVAKWSNEETMVFFFPSAHACSLIGALLLAISVDGMVGFATQNLPSILADGGGGDPAVLTIQPTKGMLQAARAAPTFLYTLLALKLLEYGELFDTTVAASARDVRDSKYFRMVICLAGLVTAIFVAVLMNKDGTVAHFDALRIANCPTNATATSGSYPGNDLYDRLSSWRQTVMYMFIVSAGLFCGAVAFDMADDDRVWARWISRGFYLTAVLVPWILYGVYMGIDYASYFQSVCYHSVTGTDKQKFAWGLDYLATIGFSLLLFVRVLYELYIRRAK